MTIHPQAFSEHLSTERIGLVGNMFFQDSPGHMIWELDNFLRMKHLGETPSFKRFYAVFKNGPLKLPTNIAETLPHVFNDSEGVRIICDDNLHKIALQLHALNPSIAVDAGLSHFKTVIPDQSVRKASRLMHLPGHPIPLTWVLSHEINLSATLEYFRRRAETPDFCPLASISPLSPELESLLGGKVEKIALIHIRSYLRGKGSAGNAGTVTDPDTLLPTLGYLKDMGYTLVKVGFEPYPVGWDRYPVINYAQSPLMSYANDLKLLKAAKFIMVNASGFENLSEIIGTPMVSYGRWSIGVLIPGPNVVHLPTLVRWKKNGRFLRFSEQIHHSFCPLQLWEKGDALNFPSDILEPRAPSSEDLLESVQEAISLGQCPRPRSPDQERFIDLRRHSNFAHVQGRVSQRFLERFPEALECGYHG